MERAFAYHFVVHRILPVVVSIVISLVALYYLVELSITGCLAIVARYYGSTFDMNTGCPLSNISCTDGKLAVYPGMGYWLLYSVGLVSAMLEICIFIVLVSLLCMLFECVDRDYIDFKRKHSLIRSRGTASSRGQHDL